SPLISARSWAAETLIFLWTLLEGIRFFRFLLHQNHRQGILVYDSKARVVIEQGQQLRPAIEQYQARRLQVGIGFPLRRTVLHPVEAAEDFVSVQIGSPVDGDGILGQ